MLRLRSDEAEQRAESMLAGPVGRIRWAAAEVVLAMGGIALLMAVAGVSSGLGYGAAHRVDRRRGQPPAGRGAGPGAGRLGAGRAGGGAVRAGCPGSTVPAAWTVLARGRAAGPARALAAAAPWLPDLTPFTHVPKLPGGDFTATPLIWLTAVAAGLTVAGLAAFRRRDLT